MDVPWSSFHTLAWLPGQSLLSNRPHESGPPISLSFSLSGCSAVERPHHTATVGEHITEKGPGGTHGSSSTPLGLRRLGGWGQDPSVKRDPLLTLLRKTCYFFYLDFLAVVIPKSSCWLVCFPACVCVCVCVRVSMWRTFIKWIIVITIVMYHSKTTHKLHTQDRNDSHGNWCHK